MSMPVRVSVSVCMSMYAFMLMRMFMPMIVIVIVIVRTVILSFHPAHLTLLVPAATYSSPAAGVVAPPHNTAKFE